jgi:hypothetical protein
MNMNIEAQAYDNVAHFTQNLAQQYPDPDTCAALATSRTLTHGHPMRCRKPATWLHAICSSHESVLTRAGIIWMAPQCSLNPHNHPQVCSVTYHPDQYPNLLS